MRHASYIIKRITIKALSDTTPYERYFGRKPNIEHLRGFGCIAYAKVLGPNLKKLDDRSKKLVYFGSEPGSKAYRLFDPSTRKIIVSRDVVFDEKATWAWNSGLEDELRSGMFWVQ